MALAIPAEVCELVRSRREKESWLTERTGHLAHPDTGRFLLGTESYPPIHAGARCPSLPDQPASSEQNILRQRFSSTVPTYCRAGPLINGQQGASREAFGNFSESIFCICPLR
jgi:hypothetical protein